MKKRRNRRRRRRRRTPKNQLHPHSSGKRMRAMKNSSYSKEMMKRKKAFRPHPFRHRFILFLPHPSVPSFLPSPLSPFSLFFLHPSSSPSSPPIDPLVIPPFSSSFLPFLSSSIHPFILSFLPHPPSSYSSLPSFPVSQPQLVLPLPSSLPFIGISLLLLLCPPPHVPMLLLLPY